jgi:hypothetical protein
MYRASKPMPWAAAISLALLAATVHADLVLVQKPLTRRFPLNYCPFETRDVDPSQNEFGLYFTPTATTVTLHFKVANMNQFGFWGENRIDNIIVVSRAVFEANRGVPDGFADCYSDPLPGYPNTGNNAPAFFFNRFAPGALPFIERFDTTPVGDPNRPWDLSHGAYFLPQNATTDCKNLSPKPSSAPRNPENGTDCSNGALAMGQESDLNVDITTSIVVNGLAPGTEYIVVGWWDTNDFTLENPLEVTVTQADIANDAPALRSVLRLSATPNPFNPSTRLRFELPVAGPARLAIVDVAGRHVRTIVDGVLDAGPQERSWDGRDDAGTSVGSGVYFARLQSGAHRASFPLVLVR